MESSFLTSNQALSLRSGSTDSKTLDYQRTNLATAAKSLQSCLTLCDPIDGSPPGSPVLGILQARTLEWVAISFSSAWKWKVKVKSLSHIWLFVTPWTAAYQAPLSMGFSRQEYWSGVPSPSPRQLWGRSKFLFESSGTWLFSVQNNLVTKETFKVASSAFHNAKDKITFLCGVRWATHSVETTIMVNIVGNTS